MSGVQIDLAGLELSYETTVRIYDAMGRMRRYLDSHARSGTIYWDGRNDLGGRVPPGVYYVVVEMPVNRLVEAVLVLGHTSLE